MTITTPATGTTPETVVTPPAVGTPEYNAAMVELYENQGKPPAAVPDPAAVKAERPEYIPEKFWDAEKGVARYEDLAKSYTELEKVKGGTTPDPEAKPAGGETDPAAAAVEAAGLDWDKVAAEFTTSGTLTPESFEALEKAGVPREIAESYIADKKVVAEHRKALTGTYLSAAHGDGKDGGEMLTELLTWAGQSLEPAAIDAYNKMLGGPDWQTAIDTLATKYKATKLTGSEGSAVLPGFEALGGSGGAAAFQSSAEMTAAMRDPRYKADPAYRRQVQQRTALMK